MNAWIHIDTSGRSPFSVTGQKWGRASYQAIPQIIAEELEVNLDEVNIVFAQGDNKKYGSQITGGSSTVRGSYKNLLNLSATAREMLIAAAAKNGVFLKQNVMQKPAMLFTSHPEKSFIMGNWLLMPQNWKRQKMLNSKPVQNIN